MHYVVYSLHGNISCSQTKRAIATQGFSYIIALLPVKYDDRTKFYFGVQCIIILLIRLFSIIFRRVLAGFGEETENVECGYDGCQTQGLENQACFPIPIPYNDKVFGRLQKPCLTFVRSQQVPSAYTCELCT